MLRPSPSRAKSAPGAPKRRHAKHVEPPWCSTQKTWSLKNSWRSHVSVIALRHTTQVGSSATAHSWCAIFPSYCVKESRSGSPHTSQTRHRAWYESPLVSATRDSQPTGSPQRKQAFAAGRAADGLLVDDASGTAGLSVASFSSSCSFSASAKSSSTLLAAAAAGLAAGSGWSVNNASSCGSYNGVALRPLLRVHCVSSKAAEFHGSKELTAISQQALAPAETAQWPSPNLRRAVPYHRLWRGVTALSGVVSRLTCRKSYAEFTVSKHLGVHFQVTEQRIVGRRNDSGNS